MAHTLNFLNTNSGALTVVFTAIVTISTVVYASLTAALVIETKKMRAAQTEPRIDISIHPREDWINFIDLEIRNIGQGPAYDIRFEVDPGNDSAANKQLADQLLKLNMVRNGLRYLSPRREVRTFFTSMTDNFELKSTAKCDIEISYRNASNEQYNETYILDFSEMIGLHQLGEPPLYKLANKIEAIERNFDRIINGFQKANFNIFTSDDRSREREERELQVQEFRKEQQAENPPTK